MSSCKLYCENFKIYNDCCKNSEQQSESGEGILQNLNNVEIQLLSTLNSTLFIPPLQAGGILNTLITIENDVSNEDNILPNINLATINGWNGLFGGEAEIKCIDISMPKIGFNFQDQITASNIEVYSLIVNSTSMPNDLDNYSEFANLKYVYAKSIITLDGNTSPIHLLLFFDDNSNNKTNFLVCFIGSDDDFSNLILNDIDITLPDTLINIISNFNIIILDKKGVIEPPEIEPPEIEPPEIEPPEIEPPEIDLTNQDLSNKDLTDIDLSNTDLSGKNLSGSNLRDMNLQGSILIGANLTGANLSGANLSGVNISDAILEGVKLQGANLNQTNLQNSFMSGANLSNAILNNTILNNVILNNANLSGANLNNANLNNANLNNANLNGVTSGAVTGIPASLPIGYILLNGYIIGPNVILSDANLQDMNLIDIDLSNANLNNANLSGAILEGANLSGANINNVSLDFQGEIKLATSSLSPDNIPDGYEFNGNVSPPVLNKI